jgi:hypothetical protein
MCVQLVMLGQGSLEKLENKAGKSRPGPGRDAPVEETLSRVVLCLSRSELIASLVKTSDRGRAMTPGCSEYF